MSLKDKAALVLLVIVVNGLLWRWLLPVLFPSTSTIVTGEQLCYPLRTAAGLSAVPNAGGLAKLQVSRLGEVGEIGSINGPQQRR